MITIVGTKSRRAKVGWPFVASVQSGSMSVKVETEDDQVRIDMDNVPLDDGIESFFKKFGVQDGDRLLVDMDSLGWEDFLPYAMKLMTELHLKSSRELIGIDLAADTRPERSDFPEMDVEPK
ncbi:hypothetical protein AVEN_71978-1 [Araneus ventricosus]|uniref:Uncharacterized protein n=1 Tax=Araneus ventricosus TaxID=182803 RepID=A0A4Y2ML68_ARAVE|nr:hypothetical protein AVEN_105587-1 [Araneus ventricosus]GBN26895.1 hypothetical protein AVEN_133130-1 [Araneus ventricosus]GBN27099.1 hypothetical protein AVEN_37666-1 [Araneus ventricosus]GBN27110.1 hypothetical protein AVEN_71978-1 [Araneus ventricosus]